MPIVGSNPQAYMYTTVTPDGSSSSSDSLVRYTAGSGVPTIAVIWELGSAAVPGTPPSGAGDTYRARTHLTYRLLGDQADNNTFGESLDFVFP